MSEKKAGPMCNHRAQEKTESISSSRVAVPGRISRGFAGHPQASPSKAPVAFVTYDNPDRFGQARPPYSEPPFAPPKTAWFDGQPVKRRHQRRKEVV